MMEMDGDDTSWGTGYLVLPFGIVRVLKELFGYGVSLLPGLSHPYFLAIGAPNLEIINPLERIQIHCSGYFIVKLGDFHRHMRT